MYLLESPRRGDSNKYTKPMFHKKLLKKVSVFVLKTGPYQVLYNSKFDLTAKSLVTKTVVITRVLFILPGNGYTFRGGGGGEYTIFIFASLLNRD